jgi:hypothetical protein
VVRIFHGGSFQLLQTVGVFLLSPRRPAAVLPAQVFHRDDPLPALQPDQLVTAAGTAVDPIGELTSVLTELANDSTAAPPPELLDALREMVRIAAQDRDSIRERLRSSPAFSQSPEFQGMCERTCAITAAACAARTWWSGRHTWEPELASGEWLTLALHHVLRIHSDTRRPVPAAVQDRVAELLFRLHREGRQYSLVPHSLVPLG